MIKKIILSIFVLVCLIGTTNAVTYIPAGTVDNYNMNVVGETYVLLGNVTAESNAFLATADDTTLIGNGSTIFYANSSSGRGVYITGDNVTLDGLTCVQESSQSSSYGAYLYQSNNNTIIDSVFVSTAGYGLYMRDSEWNTVTNVSAESNSGYGVYLYSNADNNTVTYSTFESDGTIGMYLSGSNNNDVSYCNASSVSNNGIRITSSTGNTVSNCNADATSSYAMYLYSSSTDNIIESNTFTATSGIGLFIDSDANDNHILNNTATSDSGVGFRVSGSTGNYIYNTSGHSTDDYGVYIVSSANNNTFVLLNASSVNSDGIKIYSGANNNTFTSLIASSETLKAIRIRNVVGNIFNGTPQITSPVQSAPHSTNDISLLGDSITDGGASGVPIGAWGLNLSDSLNSVGTWYVSNEGSSGETALEATGRITSELQLFTPEIIIIAYGTNDLGDSRLEQDIIDDVMDMADEADASGAVVYIMGIPPSASNNDGKIAYSQNLSIQSNEAGYKYIDVYDILDTVPGNGEYDEYDAAYSVDGTHPNTAGNELIAAAVYEQIYEDFIYIDEFENAGEKSVNIWITNLGIVSIVIFILVIVVPINAIRQSNGVSAETIYKMVAAVVIIFVVALVAIIGTGVLQLIGELMP